MNRIFVAYLFEDYNRLVCVSLREILRTGKICLANYLSFVFTLIAQNGYLNMPFFNLSV